jgi:hypothetical protein
VHGGPNDTCEEVEAMIKTVTRNNPILGTFEDDVYIVEVKAHPYGSALHDKVYWLDISRKDGSTDVSWADMQSIKNELIGKENEGFQIYPPESRLVDLGNHYHMWVFRKPEDSLGFGFKYRKVNEPGDKTPEGK